MLTVNIENFSWSECPLISVVVLHLQIYPPNWNVYVKWSYLKDKKMLIIPPLQRRGVYCFTSVCPKIFFSATIGGRNLIFGQKLHIGMPYSGKRFWTRQIPTSCFPDLVGFYTHWTYMWVYHKWANAHSSSCYCADYFI